MKHTLLIAATVLVLAGCNAPAPQAQSEVTTTPGETMVVETPAAPCPAQTGYNPFPADLTLPFPYHLRADRIYVRGDGQERRRVTVEFLEGNSNAALAQTERSMIDAGFKAQPRKDGSEGKVTIAFTQKGLGTAHVTAISSAGPNPHNPAAKGLISVDYPLTANPQQL